jgi:hypothetical protein
MAQLPGFLRQDIAGTSNGLKTGHYRLIERRRSGAIQAARTTFKLLKKLNKIKTGRGAD